VTSIISVGNVDPAELQVAYVVHGICHLRHREGVFAATTPAGTLAKLRAHV
jgi:hypothetical protein